MSEQIKEGDNVMHPAKHSIGTVRYITGKYAAVLFGKTTMAYMVADLERVELKTEEEIRRANAQDKA